jgi:hypothetical protein
MAEPRNPPEMSIKALLLLKRNATLDAADNNKIYTHRAPAGQTITHLAGPIRNTKTRTRRRPTLTAADATKKP